MQTKYIRPFSILLMAKTHLISILFTKRFCIFLSIPCQANINKIKVIIMLNKSLGHK